MKNFDLWPLETGDKLCRVKMQESPPRCPRQRIFSWTEENQGLLTPSSHPSCLNTAVLLSETDITKQFDEPSPGPWQQTSPPEGLRRPPAPRRRSTWGASPAAGRPPRTTSRSWRWPRTRTPSGPSRSWHGAEHRQWEQAGPPGATRHRDTLTLTGPWPAGRSVGPAGTCLSSGRCRWAPAGCSTRCRGADSSSEPEPSRSPSYCPSPSGWRLGSSWSRRTWTPSARRRPIRASARRRISETFFLSNSTPFISSGQPSAANTS